MKFISQPFALAVTAALAISMNVLAEGTQQQQDQMSQQAGMQTVEPKSEMVQFDKGSALLNKDATKKLDKFVKDAKESGQAIDHLTIVAWSDTKFPLEQQQQSGTMSNGGTAAGQQDDTMIDQEQRSQQQAGQESGQTMSGTQPVTASQQDIMLAQKRVDAIQSYLKSQLSVENVRTVVMGKDHAEWFARAFAAPEEELSSQFARAGETPVNEKEFKIIKDKAKESVGLVLLTPSMAQQQQQQQEGMDSGAMTPDSGTETDSGSGY